MRMSIPPRSGALDRTYQKICKDDDEKGNDSLQGNVRVTHCENQKSEQAVLVDADGNQQKSEEEGEFRHVRGFE